MENNQTEHSRCIFGNPMSDKVYKKSVASKNNYIKKFGDDTNADYHLQISDTPAIGDSLGTRNLCISDTPMPPLDENSIIIGNIRMGFGHYRISMAMASAAHSLGYTPYWFDLHSFKDTTCGRIIEHQNSLYSLGSRLSQKSSLFNKLYWEPLNSEGFRKLSYNSIDQKNAELMTPLFHDIPKDTPFIATHVWPAQAAIHAGMTNVVNAIPDNWPMALHLAEGSIHTVQTPSSYLGYKALRGMDKARTLKPMPDESIVYTGHYIDHELVSNIDIDCDARIARISNGKARRYLLTVGGAGAQKDFFAGIIKTLLPAIKEQHATLFINVGDHRNVWEELSAEIPAMQEFTTKHFNNFNETSCFANNALVSDVYGIHVFYHDDIFAAVYSTNLLMRACDILVTKPSELAFYPVPKLMIKRVGGHEAWGAIRAAEIGDGTYECETLSQTIDMLNLIQNDGDIIIQMCNHIKTANNCGIYNGAYNAVQLALSL